MTNVKIHPTAIIADGAELGEGVEVGPYSCIGPKVKVHDRVKVYSHVVLEGNTTIGEETEVFPFASIGHVTQDKKYQGEDSTLVIGKGNKIREYVTMQAGTAEDRMTTIVGDHGLFMAGSHVAHDCVVGNHVTMANNATLAGHVIVGDHVIIGGLAAIHQRVRVGEHAIISGLAAVAYDVIPYGLVKGVMARLYGLNKVGLKRHNVSREDIETLTNVYKDLFEQEGIIADKAAKASEVYQNNARAMDLIRFVESHEGRSLTTPL